MGERQRTHRCDRDNDLSKGTTNRKTEFVIYTSARGLA